MDAQLETLEKRKFGTTDAPRTCKDSTSRYIPADVRRTVHKRDGGRCTFVSASGKRCGETAFLELDHILPVAMGGKSTAENLRERCRTHNQYTSELAFGRSHAREPRATYTIRPGTSGTGRDERLRDMIRL